MYRHVQLVRSFFYSDRFDVDMVDRGWQKRKQYEIIRKILSSDEDRSKISLRKEFKLTRSIVNFFVSNSGRVLKSSGRSGNFGQFSEGFSRNGGPVHHKGWFMISDGNNPLDAQSTGFNCIGTWFHIDEEVSSRIWFVRFAMNVAYRWGNDRIQTNAVVESVHAFSWSIWRRSWNVLATNHRSLAIRTAPHYSR